MSLDTLAAPAQHDIVVRHSRFLARAVAVEGTAQAQDWLRQVAVADATHNCWAWRVAGEYRSSDDGEPAGTAGRPILASIDGQGFDRVAVVVTRWFGGVKLGAGGLVRAYGGAAAECLRLAERLPLVAQLELAVHAGFDDLGAVHAALESFAAEKLDEIFAADGAHFRVRLPALRADDLKNRLRDATRDRVRFEHDRA
ncbi:YigZ family protein [Luteimonas sp. SJ-92]|uniref:YigZ family protein n=1 Tax=Luteimonas salinisoli TaxID=2752307 RepID=A0A853JIR1_9GAMM|nr:YigZ family protein [Luteimonas salinisoli]NZA28427.1 YigZ family protein [Luteimonas salinisoli]